MSCNGCTDCCKVPTVFHHVPSSVRHDNREHWVVISKRRAKKLNPYLIRRIKTDKSGVVTYHKCRRLTDSGCSIYEDRPFACREYLKDNTELSSAVNKGYVGSANEYTDNCNLIAKFKMEVLGAGLDQGLPPR